MSVYYNEFDPMAADWLRYLMLAGLIPMGDVDERSIIDVQPDDLKGYTQCHFFAGIGGWAYALELAGWGDRPVWTGSCPCQPFSAAGRQKGEKDVRHLWPEFHRLIAECRPATVFGEQVASKLGRDWLAGVFTDLESVGYAAAGADLCAASVGAPHIRQRLWWVGSLADPERCVGDRGTDEPERGSQGRNADRGLGEADGSDGGLADPQHDGSHPPRRTAPEPDSDGQDGRVYRGSADSGLADADRGGRGQAGESGGLPEVCPRGTDERLSSASAGALCRDGGLADAECGAAERHGHEVESEARGLQGAAREQRVRDDARDGGAGSGGGLGNADGRGCEIIGQSEHGDQQGQSGEQFDGSGPRRLGQGPHCGLGNSSSIGSAAGLPEPAPGQEGDAGEPIDAGGAFGAWGSYIWIPCADGKARRIEPGIAPLAHGVSGRVAQLRGLGNAIVPQVAAAFIEAYLEVAE